jgi:hypothetical protein
MKKVTGRYDAKIIKNPNKKRIFNKNDDAIFIKMTQYTWTGSKKGY